MNLTPHTEILGLIPARGGSRGLPGKNIRPLAGHPLIAHTIMAARASRLLTRLVVVTDDPHIGEVSRRYGAETPFPRPAELSADDTHAFAVYKYTLARLKELEGYRPDFVCALFCTTPFRSTEDIDLALRPLLEGGCDWSFTINEIEHHPYRAMRLEGETMRPLFDLDRSLMWANRQELPALFRFNGGVIAGRSEHIEQNQEYNIDASTAATVRLGYHLMPASRSLDIDTLEDFEYVEWLLNRSARPEGLAAEQAAKP